MADSQTATARCCGVTIRRNNGGYRARTGAPMKQTPSALISVNLDDGVFSNWCPNRPIEN